MKKRLLFWIDKITYVLKDTMPNKELEPDCFEEQKLQIKELELIKNWILTLP